MSGSHAFGFFDETGRSALLAYAGHPAARRGQDDVVCVFLPDGSLGLIQARRGRVIFECEIPQQRWRVRYTGELGVVDPSLVPICWDQGLFALPRRRAEIDLVFDAVHAETTFGQAGTVRGRSSVDGEEVAFAGRAVRHPSVARSQTLAASFDGLAFFVAGSSGYVWRDGRLSALTSVESEISSDRLRLELRAEDGGRTAVTGQLLRRVQLPARAGGVVQLFGEGYARFECDGRTSLGLARITEQVG